jgi:hypothetical protein
MKFCLKPSFLLLLFAVIFILLLLVWMPSARAWASSALAFARPATPPSGNFDGPAELPRIYMDSSLSATPAPGKTFLVHATDDISGVLAKASCGDTIQLQAGATFGKLLLPAKNCDDAHWIIIRSSASDSKLPPEGTRLTPCYAGVLSLPGRPAYPCTSPENVLAKVESPGKSLSAILFAPGANHYRLIGLEVTRSESTGVIYNLIGPDKGTADHLVFDRMWVHGTAQDETVRGVMLSHIRYAAVVDSYFTDFHCVAKSGACVDSQAVAGGLGDDPMGPFKIVNNFLEAAAESIQFGGDRATATPTDIEVRRNHMFRPLIWMKGQPGFIGGRDGNPFIVKNVFELKNAQRVLLDGNILEYSWGGFSQAGYAILLTPKNQAIGINNVCPACLVTDVTIRNCTVSHVAGGLQIGNGVSSNGGAAKDGGRYSIHDVVVDDINPDRYNGFGVFAQISMTPGVSESPRLHDVSIDHVTAFPPRNLFVIGGPLVDPKMRDLSITNSMFSSGEQPIATTGGGADRNCSAMPKNRAVEDVLHQCFSSYTFHNNVIIGGGGGWPKDNQTPKKAADVGFVAYRDVGGDYRLSRESKFKGTGSDKKDVGADFDAITRAIAGVE